jgi:hypothetical protein
LGAGRKCVYEEKVKCRFDDIERWLKGGATERQIAAALGIAYSTFNWYKVQFLELTDLIKSVDRTNIVLDLRSALLKKAMGFKYTEKKTYKKKDEITGNETSYIEVVEKEALPDVAAINLALKNYDKENWANDPALLDIKKEELELKKKLAEQNEW